MAPKEKNQGLVVSGTSQLIQRLDLRLDLVNRLLDDIKSPTASHALDALERIDANMARRFLDDRKSVNISNPS